MILVVKRLDKKSEEIYVFSEEKAKELNIPIECGKVFDLFGQTAYPIVVCNNEKELKKFLEYDIFSHLFKWEKPLLKTIMAARSRLDFEESDTLKYLSLDEVEEWNIYHGEDPRKKILLDLYLPLNYLSYKWEDLITVLNEPAGYDNGHSEYIVNGVSFKEMVKYALDNNANFANYSIAGVRREGNNIAFSSFEKYAPEMCEEISKTFPDSLVLGVGEWQSKKVSCYKDGLPVAFNGKMSLESSVDNEELRLEISVDFNGTTIYVGDSFFLNDYPTANTIKRSEIFEDLENFWNEVSDIKFSDLPEIKTALELIQAYKACKNTNCKVYL